MILKDGIIMFKIGIRQIAFTMAGCFFGAGFVSGQELWQFFGRFGNKGLVGMALACVILGVLTFITVDLASKSGITDMDSIIVPGNIKWLKGLAGALEIAFMYCINIIMISGAGTLVEQLTGSFALRVAVSAVFCVCVTLVSLKGIGGAVRIFALITPILITVSMITVIGIAVKNGGFGFKFTPISESNPLLGNWSVSAVTYISYNYFSAIGTIAALGRYARSRGAAALGSAAGCICLAVVAFGIASAISAVPDSAATELPLLALSAGLHPIAQIIVSVALMLAMFGAAVSVYVPIPTYFGRFEFFSRRRILLTSLASAAAMLLSLFGFSDLIGIVYPVFGYIAAAAILGLIVNYILFMKKILDNINI